MFLLQSHASHFLGDSRIFHSFFVNKSRGYSKNTRSDPRGLDVHYCWVHFARRCLRNAQWHVFDRRFVLDDGILLDKYRGAVGRFAGSRHDARHDEMGVFGSDGKPDFDKMTQLPAKRGSNRIARIGSGHTLVTPRKVWSSAGIFAKGNLSRFCFS